MFLGLGLSLPQAALRRRASGPSFSLTGPASISESAGPYNATLVVIRNGSTAAFSYTYSTAGTGTNPVDATDFGGSLPSGSGTIASGATSATISLPVNNDTSYEPDETGRLTVVVNGQTLTLDFTITNDDPAPPTYLRATSNKQNLTEAFVNGTDATAGYTYIATAEPTGNYYAEDGSNYAVATVAGALPDPTTTSTGKYRIGATLPVVPANVGIGVALSDDLSVKTTSYTGGFASRRAFLASRGDGTYYYGGYATGIPANNGGPAPAGNDWLGFEVDYAAQTVKFIVSKDGGATVSSQISTTFNLSAFNPGAINFVIQSMHASSANGGLVSAPIKRTIS